METELQVLTEDSLVERLVGAPEHEQKKIQTQDTSKLELMKESSEQWIKILNTTNIRRRNLKVSALLN